VDACKARRAENMRSTAASAWQSSMQRSTGTSSGTTMYVKALVSIPGGKGVRNSEAREPILRHSTPLHQHIPFSIGERVCLRSRGLACIRCIDYEHLPDILRREAAPIQWTMFVFRRWTNGIMSKHSFSASTK
jgi:hypothetical protein